MLARLPPWRLTVRRWPALAQTRITLEGAADHDAVDALEREVARARERGDAVTLDLGGLETSSAAARPIPPRPDRE